MASSRNLVSTFGAQASPKMGRRNQLSGRVSFPCWHATCCKCSMETTRNSVMVNVGSKVMKWAESLIGWEVTIGQGSEYYLTFVRGKLHIAE